MGAQLVKLLPGHVLACHSCLVEVSGELFESGEEAVFEGGPPVDEGVGFSGGICAAGCEGGDHGCTGLGGGEGGKAQAGKALAAIIWGGWA